jgi:hypothetical protein
MASVVACEFRRPALATLQLVVVAIAAMVSSGCVSAQRPELIEIVPASGPAGAAYPLQATIRGTGFQPAGNVIDFGPVRISGLPSTEPGRIRFSIPKDKPTGGEVPPMVLPPGQYRVTLTTTAGTSNALIFTLTSGP